MWHFTLLLFKVLEVWRQVDTETHTNTYANTIILPLINVLSCSQWFSALAVICALSLSSLLLDLDERGRGLQEHLTGAQL